LETSFLHPAFKLKAQHMAFPDPSFWAKDFSSWGHIAFAFADVFGLLTGLPAGLLAGLGAGVLELLLSASFGALLGSGSKNIVTRGSVRSSFNFFSMGKAPVASGCKDPCSSWAMIVNNSLSALLTWLVDTFEKPLGGSLVSCVNNCCTQTSCSAFPINEHWSNANPLR
jgi:hypothetical protein